MCSTPDGQALSWTSCPHAQRKSKFGPVDAPLTRWHRRNHVRLDDIDAVLAAHARPRGRRIGEMKYRTAYR